VEFTRQHVIGVLRRAGLWDEAEEVEASLPDSADLDEVAKILGDRGITHDTLISLLGGSP
jgi:hypothetical protein